MSNSRLFGVRRRRRSAGAALVEFAIVLPLVILLLMGILDFGFAFANLNSMRHGARESARRAVVADVGSYSGCVVTGGSAAADTKSLMCQVKDKSGLDEGKLRVMVALDASHTEGEGLIICSQYPLESITGLFSGLLNGKTLNTEVHMRIEKVSDISIASAAETSPNGGDWSWCG